MNIKISSYKTEINTWNDAIQLAINDSKEGDRILIHVQNTLIQIFQSIKIINKNKIDINFDNCNLECYILNSDPMFHIENCNNLTFTSNGGNINGLGEFLETSFINTHNNKFSIGFSKINACFFIKNCNDINFIRIIPPITYCNEKFVQRYFNFIRNFHSGIEFYNCKDINISDIDISNIGKFYRFAY